MYKIIENFIYGVNLNQERLNEQDLSQYIAVLAKKAFIDSDEDSLLLVHRILYVINLAHLSVSWEKSAVNLNHPLIAGIKFEIESYWEQSEKNKYRDVLSDLPDTKEFPLWVKNKVAQHPSNELHPIFTFLKDKANFKQMQEFLFQETPLEMLFGDILAFMLPGVYGTVKVEFLKNYWDEVGHANDEKVHRNLRAQLMKQAQIPADAHLHHIESFVREELELVNMYLSLATNRAKHGALLGTMLATELMIPNRFQYSIDGWKRLGLKDQQMVYLTEHISVDAVHAEDWLNHVIMPVLAKNPMVMKEILFGVFRRLNVSVAVLDRLYQQIQAIAGSSMEGLVHAAS